MFSAKQQARSRNRRPRERLPPPASYWKIAGRGARRRVAADIEAAAKRQPSDPVPFPLELVSAEIKIDASQSVTAFGQACAYRLFSHKVYIVMPITIEAVKDHLERPQGRGRQFNPDRQAP